MDVTQLERRLSTQAMEARVPSPIKGLAPVPDIQDMRWYVSGCRTLTLAAYATPVAILSARVLLSHDRYPVALTGKWCPTLSDYSSGGCTCRNFYHLKRGRF